MVPAGTSSFLYGMPFFASQLFAMSQDVLNFALPIGSNWKLQSADRRSALTGVRACRSKIAGFEALRERPEDREVGERRDQAAEHDDLLAADPVGQRAEHDEERRGEDEAPATIRFAAIGSTFSVWVRKNSS